ncbi:MAG: outer membrane protein assembly factor BamD [Candidatus Omnitrophica bacterium]|nr:outer membrane protein assembly factor BamD [Candidatus Omnitrophota bacterium]
MKKIYCGIILIGLCVFIPDAHAFWIWSPKTQEWKNPKYSALASPYLQYKQALEYFEAGSYKEAYAEFRKLLTHYPDAKEAADGQYYVGRTLEKLGKPYQAFEAYEKVIDRYPNSKRINEVVEHQYQIGEFFLNREGGEMLGLSIYDFVQHPSIEIFKSIVEKVPYSELAPKAQYKLGLLYLELGRYEEAKDAFQKAIDNYPESEWAAPSKYQLAIATAKFSAGAEYDTSAVKQAADRLDEFIEAHPDAEISESAQTRLRELRNQEAKKAFDIAVFYEKQHKTEAARLYYARVTEQFPESPYAERAQRKLQQLNGQSE